MRTRLLFWVLLLSGVATLALSAIRSAPAALVIGESKCAGWNCANPAQGYNSGYILVNGNQVPVSCDLSSIYIRRITTCVQNTNTGCLAGTSYQQCTGTSVPSPILPPTTCYVDFYTCTGTVIPPSP